jgi:2-iminobutanoate/2-iminopropanoate deaminase
MNHHLNSAFLNSSFGNTFGMSLQIIFQLTFNLVIFSSLISAQTNSGKPMKTVIKTEQAPLPIGPYNQAVATQGQLLFTAGQIALDAKSGQMVGTTIQEQTKQVCENLKAILLASHTDFKYAVKTTVFLKNFNDFAAMNEVYAQYFGEASPARSTVEVVRLPKDALVEIEVVALIP